MKKQKKQGLLNIIIIILVIALIMMIGLIIYEERINKLKQSNTDETIDEGLLKDEEIKIVDDVIDKNEDFKEVIEQPDEPNEETDYVGEEENNSTKDIEQSKDEKAIELVKKEYGEDESVTFSIEQKDGSKYYVAIKNEDTETIWYEVDTETWTVNEY